MDGDFAARMRGACEERRVRDTGLPHKRCMGTNSTTVSTAYPSVPAAPVALRPEDAAVLISVSPRTLREWRRTGYGPRWLQRGRVVLYPVAGLTAWLEEEAA
jgi:hypothetical protein